MYQKHRVAQTRFRCANHNLAINKLRPTHDRVDRICKYCHENNNVNIIEDEYHFMFMCPLFILYSKLFQPSISRFFY